MRNRAQSLVVFRLAFPSVYQSLLEMWKSLTIGISQEVTALKKSRRNIEVLGWSWPRSGWRTGIEARRAHATQIIVVTDWLLLTSYFHFFVFLVSVLPMNLFEMHRNFAQLLKSLSRHHHFLSVAKITTEKLLHHIHIVNDERVKSLQISRRIQLFHKINLERSFIDRFTALCTRIRLVTTEKESRKMNVKANDGNVCKLTMSTRRWWMHMDETCLIAFCFSRKSCSVNPPTPSLLRNSPSGCRVDGLFGRSEKR